MDGYARKFTPGWVDYFRRNIGGRPTDSFWREFRSTLGTRTAEICWYCERQCERPSEVSSRAATVDHFKPLSRFPELAYQWTNWIFSCKRCNEENKQDRWPALGYVDPCADDERQRPERHLDYDILTGEIIPHPALRGDERRKAEATIADLGLNLIDVRFYRFHAIQAFTASVQALPDEDQRAFVEFAFARPMEYVGSAQKASAQLWAAGEN